MSNAEPIISVRNLSRTFEGVDAVRDVSFDVFPGQVVGFIGANGAGKTTAMRIMATLDQPTRGSVSIGGHDVVNYPAAARARIGWMPDAYGAYEYMTVLEYLDFYARAFGFKKEDRSRRVVEVMEFTDLVSIADRMMNKLSKGMAQRLCLARTLLHDPDVLILDEPAAGLDPKARVEFKQLVRLLGTEGRTIFISSHILSELAEMCDTMLFIDAGRIVHHGSAESLQQGGDRVLYDIHVHGAPEPLLTWIELNPGVSLADAHKRGARVTFESPEPEAVSAHLRRMLADGVPVIEFHRETRKLEDAFVEMLKKV